MQIPVFATVELSVCLSVCPFVCPLSVTRWYCIKTTQARITKPSPTDSQRTLVLAIKSSSRNSKGLTPNDGVKMRVKKSYGGCSSCWNFLLILDSPRSLLDVRKRLLKFRVHRVFSYEDIVIRRFSKFGSKRLFTVQKFRFWGFRS